MKTVKVIGNCCFVFLALIGTILSLVFCYYHFFIKDITVGVNYIDNQDPIDLVEKADTLSAEEIEYYENRVLFNVNYYSNKKENGVELQEMRLDYFTDYTLTTSACRSTGMQYVGDFETYMKSVNSKKEAQNRVVEDFYYYDTTNMISWSGGKVATQLNRDSALTIKIDDRAFQIQLTKSWSVKKGWWIFSSTTYYFSDWGDVFYDVMNAVKSNSAGFGDYYITIDLSDYFTIREFDTDSGKYKSNDVVDIIKNYAVLKFHYDENGALNSSQSLYNCIACNPSFDVEDKNIDTKYWQERVVYNLSNEDFQYRYSDVYKGYFVSLSMDTKQLFNEMPRAKVNINISTNYDNKKIVGIDYNGFENFEIDTLSILSEDEYFYVLEKGMFNSNLQTLKYSNGTTLIYSNNATNNAFVEVIV